MYKSSKWSNGNNTNVATDLTAGVYEVTITLAGDVCFITETIVVGNVDGPSVTNIATTDATCDANNGTAIIEPQSYTYTWNDGGNGATRSDLVAGTYTVTVTDILTACFDIVEVIIEENSPMTVEAMIFNEPNCGNADGSVAILSTNGQNPTVTWEDGTTGAARNDLPAGTYTVTVTDDNGCEATTTFTLTNNVSGAVVSASDTQTSCIGSADATVDYSVSLDPDFEMPETIQIVDGDGNGYENGQLSAGNYCIVVTDGNGCIAGEACFEVTEPAALNLDVASFDADCNNGGSIDLSIAGGNQPYTVTWTDGNTDEDRSDLVEGVYSVTIVDANGCSASADNISIALDCVPCDEPVVTNTIITDATCGNLDGSITLEMEGNLSDYNFAWSGLSATTNTVNFLAVGTYSVTISNADNPDCQTVLNIDVEDDCGGCDPPVVSTIVETDATCNLTDGTAVIAMPGNLLDYTFTWSNAVSTTNTANGLAAGSYDVTIANVDD